MLRFRGSVEVAQFLGHQEGYLLVDATGVRGLRVAYEIRLRVRVHKMQPFLSEPPPPIQDRLHTPSSEEPLGFG